MKETLGQIMSGVERDQNVKPRIIANNTVRYTRPDGTVVIRLHHTDILMFSADGKECTYDTAGWKTVTTKDRFNRFGPVRVYSDRGQWYMNGNKANPYHDGITLKRVNKDAGIWLIPVSNNSRELKLAEHIKRFVNKLDKMEAAPMPEAGDCFFCQFSAGAEHIDVGGHKATQYLPARDARVRPMQKDINPDHLLSHVKEGYLHGSLIVNAMRWAGRTDFSLSYAYQNFKSQRRYIKNDLRRYLRSQLGLAV